MRVELRAISLARQYFEAKGYSVVDVSRARGHNGYDFLVKRAGKELKIEVKGASRRWGIPDPYHTEFDKDGRLIADILCVVYLIEGEKPKICLIPRDAIGPEHIAVRTGYRISSKLKKEKVLGQYVVPFEFLETDG